MPTDLLTGASPAVERAEPRGAAPDTPVPRIPAVLLLLALAWLAVTALVWPEAMRLLGLNILKVLSFLVRALTGIVVVVALTVLLVARWHLDREAPGLPARAAYPILWGRLRASVLSARWLAGAGGTFACLVLVQATTYLWKSQVGPRGFTWDARLVAWDRALHGGDPLALLAPLTSLPWLTRLVDVVYWPIWLTSLLALMGGLPFLRDSALRTRALLVYALIWIGLGAITANIMRSAGPCYLTALETGTYTPLPHLATAAPQAILLQGQLWAEYRSGTPFNGIAAMPSVHVAIAVLAACLLWRTRARWLGVAWAVVIQVGSVWLGWHWAVDGYVSAVVVVGLWCGVAWWQNQAQVAAQPMNITQQRVRAVGPGEASRST